MSSTSNKNDIDVTFVIAGMGSDNAYEKLKHHHHGVNLGTRAYNQLPASHTNETFLSSSLRETKPFKRYQTWVGLGTETTLSFAAGGLGMVGEPSIRGVVAKATAQNYFLTPVLGNLKLYETTSESYMSKAFRSYLDEVNRTPGFVNGLVTQNVKRFFGDLQGALSLKQVPNPQAMPGEDNALSLVWQDETYQIGVDVRPDGLIDWFWFDLVTDEYEGAEGVSLSFLPLDLLKRLNTAFIGS